MMKKTIAMTLLVTFVIVTILCNIGFATYHHSFTKVLGSTIEPLDKLGNAALKAFRLLGFTSYEGLYDVYYFPTGNNKLFIALPSKLKTETAMRTQTTYDLQKLEKNEFCGLTNITGHLGTKFSITNSSGISTYYYENDNGTLGQFVYAFPQVKRNLTYSELNKFIIELDITQSINPIVYEIRSSGLVLP